MTPLMLSVLPNMPAVAYHFRFRDRLRLWQPPRMIIQELAYLRAARQRLIQAYKLLSIPLAEQESFVRPSLQKSSNTAPENPSWRLKPRNKTLIDR